MTKKYIAITAAGLLISAGLAASYVFADNDKGNNDDQGLRAVGSTLEIHITNDGKALVRGAKVTGVSSSTIMAATTWGALTMNWTVKTDDRTEFVRRFGGKSGVSEVSAGDYISFAGPVDTTASTPTVSAQIIKDWSIQTRRDTFRGSIKSIQLATNNFVLASEDRGDITVTIVSTTALTKGDVAIAFTALTVGDKVTVQGLFNNASKTVTAEKVRVLINEDLQRGIDKHLFEGALKSVASSTLPTSLVLTLGNNTDVTVNVPASISLTGKNYLALPLSSFVAGDRLTVWGGMNANGSVDATLIRDNSR